MSDERCVCILCMLDAICCMLDAVSCLQDPGPSASGLRSRCGCRCVLHCVCLSTQDMRSVCESGW